MTEKKIGTDIIKATKPKKLYENARDFLFFQIYSTSEFIYSNFGLDTLKEYYSFNQNSYFDIKMSAFYKMMEKVIKKLPKSLKIKEGLKMFIDQIQFFEPLKNIAIIEDTKNKAVFEIIKCSLRKEFNKLAKKSNNPELIDKCCLWCIESEKLSVKYDINYKIEITKKGCLNYIT
ncbi:MAG: hypothetical protein ACTSRG_14440 [Candidatus Helarchaeota archaeon]